MKITASFFLRLRFKVVSCGIGNMIITISSVRLNAAPNHMRATVLIHFPFVKSQTALIGVHWKIVISTKAMQLSSRNTKYIFV